MLSTSSSDRMILDRRSPRSSEAAPNSGPQDRGQKWMLPATRASNLCASSQSQRPSSPRMEGTVFVTDRYHAWPGAGAALGHHEECVPHAGGKVEGQLDRDAPASFEQRMEDLAIHGTDDTGVNSDVGRGQVAAHWSASAAILKLHVDQQHVANLVGSGPGHRG